MEKYNFKSIYNENKVLIKLEYTTAKTYDYQCDTRFSKPFYIEDYSVDIYGDDPIKAEESVKDILMAVKRNLQPGYSIIKHDIIRFF